MSISDSEMKDRVNTSSLGLTQRECGDPMMQVAMSSQLNLSNTETELLGNIRHALDLIEADSLSISVSINQIDDDIDTQDKLSDLTSFILLPSEDTDDGALIRYFEETSAAEDNVMEARNMTNMNEDVSGGLSE